jgi:predicted transcriptional regulator
MEGSTKNTDKQIQWRRTKVLELSSQGNTQSDIAKTLHVGEATVSKEISSLRQQAQLNLKTHLNDKLPEEYQNCMTGINQVLKICWEIVNKSRNVDNDNGNGQTMTVIDNKLQALALINNCNKYKMDLTTNGIVITDAIKFVQTNKEKLTMSDKEENNGSKESK